MVVLTRVLPYRGARWANLVVPVVALAGMFTNAPRDLDGIWFLAVEAIGLLLIVWLAWTWPVEGTIGLDQRVEALITT